METLKRFIPLNFELMANPINWAIIVLMILIAGIALSLVMNQTQATAKSE